MVIGQLWLKMFNSDYGVINTVVSPAENGTSPGGAAITRADVASMTRAQREALERRAMHGVKISF